MPTSSPSLNTNASLNAAIHNAKNQARPVTVGYITAGFPAQNTFAATVESLASVFDLVEIAVPFSDPVADGPVAERLGLEAVKAHINLKFIFSSLEKLPEQVTSRLVLVGYYNNFLQYGLSRLAADCQRLAITGLLVYDLPLGEDGVLRAACPNLRLIPLLAHATSTERMETYAQSRPPYVYIAPAIGASGIEDAMQHCLSTCEKAGNVFSAPIGIRFDASLLPTPVKTQLPLRLYETSLLEHLEQGKAPESFCATS